LLPQSLNSSAEGRKIGGIIQHEIGAGGLFAIGNLVGEAIPGVGLGCTGGACHGWVRLTQTACIALNLDLVGRSDNHDAVDAPPPVRKNAFALAARTRIPFHFEYQSGLDDGHSMRIAGKNLIHPLLLGGDHGRVNDGVQFLQATAPEGQCGELAAIQLAEGRNYGWPESSHNLCINPLARLHQGAPQFIGFADLCAQFSQQASDSALAAAQAAG